MDNIIRTRSRATAPAMRENRRLTFYAAVFNEEIQVFDYAEPYKQRMNYREVLLPGSFHDTLKSDTEVVANIDHDKRRTFAKSSSGDLLLQEDEHGLFATCYLPKNKLGDEVYRDVENGKLNGASFMFATRSAKWVDGQLPLCNLQSVILDDVCLTDNPYYPGTEVHLRSNNHWDDFFRRLRICKLKAK